MCSDDGVFAAYRLDSPLGDDNGPAVTLLAPEDEAFQTNRPAAIRYTVNDSDSMLYGAFLQIATDTGFMNMQTVVTNWLLPEWETPATVILTNNVTLKDESDNFWRVIVYDNAQNVTTSDTRLVRVNIPEPLIGLTGLGMLLVLSRSNKK